jgi:hypothetical protein
MFSLGRFNRELRWFGIASLLSASAEIAILAAGGTTLLRNHSDMVEVEVPGQIASDVTKLGGPCLTIEQYEYAKYGPVGIGSCEVNYTNNDKTAATVSLQFFRAHSWVIVTADVVTSGPPLASLNWRVVRAFETSPYDLQS